MWGSVQWHRGTEPGRGTATQRLHNHQRSPGDTDPRWLPRERGARGKPRNDWGNHELPQGAALVPANVAQVPQEPQSHSRRTTLQREVCSTVAIYRTAGMGKRVRCTRLYHSRHCGIGTQTTLGSHKLHVVCFVMHDCSRKLWKQYRCELSVVQSSLHTGPDRSGVFVYQEEWDICF